MKNLLFILLSIASFGSLFAQETGDEVFTVVEVLPTYPGGNEAMYKFLSENIVYPEKAIDNNIQGRVYVSFIVEKNGSISNVKVIRGIGSGCDQEAIRVVESMPNWSPGTQRGKAVRVQFNLPINFKLSGKKSKKNKKNKKQKESFPSSGMYQMHGVKPN